MRILSWNLNGLKASVNRGDFKQLKKLYPIDVICLQEIRTKEKMEVIEGYHHYWYAAEQRRYSGTLLMSLEKPKRLLYGVGVPELDTEGRVLTAEFEDVYIVNTYAPNSQHDVDRMVYRMKWDAAYYEFLLALSAEKPVIACGDFNATLSRLDVYEENERADYAECGYESEERSNLKDIIENLHFTDAFRHLYPEREGEYTWWSLRKNRRDVDRGWRLDYFLVSEHLKEHIREVTHEKKIKGSDHCPIVLDCDVPIILGKDDKTKQGHRHRQDEEAEENKALSTRWIRRRREFEKYREKLSEIQADIALNEQMHNHDEVRRLQQSIMDDIRFRCLAVDKAAHTRGVSGVDNVKWETDADKMQAAKDLEWRNYEASPMRLIEIKTKQTGKVRRAGILTRRDKAMSILCAYTFQPVEEAHADRGSFAFRPGRSRQDAVAAIRHLFLGEHPPEIYVVAAKQIIIWRNCLKH